MIYHCRYSPTDSYLGRAGRPSHGVEYHRPARPAHWRCRWFVLFENWWCTSYWEASPRRCPLTYMALLFPADQADARQCPWCALGSDGLHLRVHSQQSQHPLVLHYIYRPLPRSCTPSWPRPSSRFGGTALLCRCHSAHTHIGVWAWSPTSLRNA